MPSSSSSSAPVSPSLHFCVIGAQKAGTTTLFEHLRRHPDLALPADKEAPFFHRAEVAAAGVDAFFRTYFPSPPPGRLLGTVTPHYMCEEGSAQRLAAAFPDLRLVAIVRDPVDRAHSHHRMATRRGQESRSFADAARSALEPGALADARRSRELAGTYVAWSEYGRVLGDYLSHFDRSQLLVVETDELAARPEAVMRAILAHIGAAAVLPDSLGQRFHEGGSRQRLPSLQRRLSRSPLGALYRRLSPATRARIFMRIDQWNVRREPSEPGGGLSPDLDAALRRHFAADERTLLDTHGVRLPWIDVGPDDGTSAPESDPV